MSLVARLDWYRFYSKRTCTAVCGSISAVGVGAGARGYSARLGAWEQVFLSVGQGCRTEMEEGAGALGYRAR